MESKIYKKAKERIGKDMSRTQNEFGCVEAVREIFRLAIGQELGGELSTIKLYNSLLSDRRFQRVVEPKLGDLIVSPTNGQYIGHTGIISDNGRVMSNNSKNSLWDEHLSIGEWWLKYKNLPIALFRYQEPVIIKEDIEAKKISILQQIISLYQAIINKLLNK